MSASPPSRIRVSKTHGTRTKLGGRALRAAVSPENTLNLASMIDGHRLLTPVPYLDLPCTYGKRQRVLANWHYRIGDSLEACITRTSTDIKGRPSQALPSSNTMPPKAHLRALCSFPRRFRPFILSCQCRTMATVDSRTFLASDQGYLQKGHETNIREADIEKKVSDLLPSR